MALYPSVLDMIGNTPLVDISALSPNPAARIYMKLEGQNPGGSVKDRVALSLIEDAERSGVLVPGKPDQVLMEPTSGNTGIGLAMVCRVKGYTSRRSCRPTSRWSAASCSSCGGPRSSSRRGPRAPTAPSAWPGPWPRSTPSGSSCTSTATRPTPRRTTRAPAPRSCATAPASRTSSPGSGRRGRCSASAASCARSSGEAVQIWAVEPPAGEMVDGLRNLDDGYIPPIFENLGGAELLDRKTVVRPRESIEWTRRLTEVGIFAGISTGAALAGAVKCAASLAEGEAASIVVVSADGGWKYLSTGAWTDDLDEVTERAKEIIYF